MTRGGHRGQNPTKIDRMSTPLDSPDQGGTALLDRELQELIEDAGSGRS